MIVIIWIVVVVQIVFALFSTVYWRIYHRMRIINLISVNSIDAYFILNTWLLTKYTINESADIFLVSALLFLYLGLGFCTRNIAKRLYNDW